jgi:hypothetical protein
MVTVETEVGARRYETAFDAALALLDTLSNHELYLIRTQGIPQVLRDRRGYRPGPAGGDPTEGGNRTATLPARTGVLIPAEAHLDPTDERVPAGAGSVDD